MRLSEKFFSLYVLFYAARKLDVEMYWLQETAWLFVSNKNKSI